MSYSYKNCTHINVIIYSIHTCIRVQFLYEYNFYTKYNYKCHTLIQVCILNIITF